jgi:hypothetical protein
MAAFIMRILCCGPRTVINEVTAPEFIVRAPGSALTERGGRKMLINSNSGSKAHKSHPSGVQIAVREPSG